MPVRGAKQTSANLRELARFINVPVNAASRWALRPVVRQAKLNIKSLALERSTGTLERSITIKRAGKSNRLKVLYRVGPDSGVRVFVAGYGFRRPVKYAHLVEFGTAPHYQPDRGVTHPGSRPRPFLTPAYFTTRLEVVKRFGERFGPEMEKRAAKLGARTK